MEKEFDILIIGGGVAGMSAGIYAKRAGKDVAIIEGLMMGGQVVNIQKVENYPSYKSISGFELIMNFQSQLTALNIPVISDEIVNVDLLGEKKCLQGKKSNYIGNKVIIASGLSYNKIGVNEDDFLGRGVSYCVVCDGHFYKGQTVAVASKGGSGIAGALKLSELCEKVYLIDSEDLSVYAKVCPKKNIEVISQAQIVNLSGENVLETISILQRAERKELQACALFVELGTSPSTKLYEGQIELDRSGFIITDEHMQTSASGVFACGDVRANPLKQIVTACSDGAIAGQYASK